MGEPVVAAMTVGDAVREARHALEQAGVAEAKREAEELYASVMRRPISAAYLDREQRIAETPRAALAEAARRRAAGWPQAYAAGSANFRGHWLAVDRRVLIPRPETEGLVDLVLAWLRTAPAPGGTLAVAEPCTGSGAIAIALALEAPSPLRIVATDCAADAVEVARGNVAALGAGAAVDVRCGDLLQPLAGETVDAVVSNPPYVAAGEWAGLDPQVRDFEPREALVSGADGLDAVRALVASAAGALGPGGLLALEVDARRASDAARLAAEAGFVGCTVLRDLFGRPRYLRARRPADGRH